MTWLSVYDGLYKSRAAATRSKWIENCHKGASRGSTLQAEWYEPKLSGDEQRLDLFSQP